VQNIVRMEVLADEERELMKTNKLSGKIAVVIELLLTVAWRKSKCVDVRCFRHPFNDR